MLPKKSNFSQALVESFLILKDFPVILSIINGPNRLCNQTWFENLAFVVTLPWSRWALPGARAKVANFVCNPALFFQNKGCPK